MKVNKMDSICCYCKKSQKCFRISHPKIREIKRLYKSILNCVPDGHESLMYCGDCGNTVLDELRTEQNAIQMHLNGLNGIPLPLSIETDQNNSIFTCTNLNCNDTLYTMISGRFNETMSNKIIRIEKISNPAQLSKFKQVQCRMNNEKVKYLFHGSANQNYDDILQNGFSLEYAKDSGSLGAGIYFAQNASYSNSFTHCIPTKEIGNIKNMLCARVIFGKIDTDTRSGSDIWAVFNEAQCYPEFIIYYDYTIGNF
jgi:hypothetical protein